MHFEQIKLKDIDNFELKDVFECGQCFRWHEEENGSYTGVVEAGILNVSKQNQDVIVKGYIKDEVSLKNFCEDYFDLKTDYKQIQKDISKNDLTMKEAIKYGKGIRILNQDPFEMLVSFIISAANNIPRISKCIENISHEYGEKVSISTDILKKMCISDKEYYLFPTSKKLSKASMDVLRECNLGFRDKYVLNAAKIVNDKKLDLRKVAELDYKKAKQELIKVEGVGSKVADCILLFSMKKSEAFPVDTWIKKIMNEVYVESRNIKKINEYAEEKWGKNAGIAQQYLFYYKRNSIQK